MGTSGGATLVKSLAEQHGYLAESLDMGNAANGVVPVSGSLYSSRLYVPTSATVTNIVMVVASPAGSGLTAGQCLVGLYSDDGQTLMSSVPDQSTAWTTTGAKVMALAVAQVVTGGTFYRVAFLANGTTPPTFRVGAASAATISAGQTGNAQRFTVPATGLTALPATFTPATTGAQMGAWAICLT